MPRELLTVDEVLAEMDAYFESGKGNPILQPLMHQAYKKDGDIPHAVLVSLRLKKVTAYERVGS